MNANQGKPLADEGAYRLLIEAITDYAIFMLDPNGFIASWNPGAERFKGYKAHEVLGKHFSQFYTEPDRQANMPARALMTARTEGRFENEGWRVRKDGTQFWAHVIIDPIRDPAGNLIGFAKITRDLTERKLAEQALWRSEQRFALLVQSVTDYAIYMLDQNGYITNWNQGAQRIKGYKPEEVIGQHFSKFYTDEDRQRGEPERGLEIALQQGRFEREGWRVRKDGTQFLAHVVIDTIRDETGRHVGFAKITRDVTERYETQRALEQAREAFFQSQKMEALGQLTGGIAHDFNNLLMAVMSSLELLRKRLPDDPKVNRLLNNALQGAQRGQSLTRRMLAFARRQELNPEPVAVATLVRDMTDLLERSLGPSIGIETHFAPNLDLAEVDANQLELALLNLAVNARDAMPGGGSIVISGSGQDVREGQLAQLKPGRYVCLSVKDSGEGMDEATLARATEPFFTTKGVGKGTGLGLSMVHGMAEQSGGTLVIKSRKGEGTTAEIWLPVSHAALAGKTDAEQKTDADAPTGTQTILAVDDDILVLVNIAAMLDDLGYDVLQAKSAAQALELLQSGQKIDLVITDQAMPDMTGTQLAVKIKAARPGLPIVLATGYADPSSIGAADFPRLGKPFSQADLAIAVAEALQRH